MTFWIITTAMSVLVALVLGRSLIQSQGSEVLDAADFDLKVYRDQLAEVARDAERGIIAPEDAERARTEISRRILQADAQRQENAAGSDGPRQWLFGVVALALVGGSLALYTQLGQPGYGDLSLKDRIALAEEMRVNRPSQQDAVESLPPEVQTGNDPAFETLMARLRETVAERPDDLQGHMLLAQNEARIGNLGGAIAAQERVLNLKGNDATATDIGDYGELLVRRAGGYVSPEAETAFRAALVLDENDGRARYILGLMMYQTGRPDITFRLWDALLRSGPATAPWIEPILAQIEGVASLAGVNYDIPQIGGAAAPGPSVDDIEAAAEMTAEERMEMIGGMVDGLSNRLATEGGPPRDWARLITSLAILGNTEQAYAVYSNAVEVYGDVPAAMDILREAGQRAGVAE